MLQSRHGVPSLSSSATHAISTVDIALWDLAGKAAGVLLYRLFGGARRITIPFYASLFRYEDPEMVAERVGAAKAEGFHHIKLHETGEADIRAARSAAGPETKLMFDSEYPKQQTAGSINPDSETVMVRAANEALTRSELLKAAYPATRISTC